MHSIEVVSETDRGRATVLILRITPRLIIGEGFGLCLPPEATRATVVYDSPGSHTVVSIGVAASEARPSGGQKPPISNGAQPIGEKVAAYIEARINDPSLITFK